MKTVSHLWAAGLAAAALLSSLGPAQSSTSATPTASEATSTSTALPASFEIDLIYPRNETYNATDTFPVVLAIQKPLLASYLGRFTFGWYIMPYDDGNKPAGITVGGTGDWIRQYSAFNFTDDTFYLVNVTNALEWHDGVSYSGNVYALKWFLRWDHALDVCGYQHGIEGRVFFSIDDNGRNPDIMDVEDECPVLSSLVEINNDVTDESTCPGITKLQGSGNPCAIKIDSAKASSISRQVASLATPPPVATTTAVIHKDNLASNLGVSTWFLQAAALLSLSLLWV